MTYSMPWYLLILIQAVFAIPQLRLSARLMRDDVTYTLGDAVTAAVVVALLVLGVVAS